MEARLGNKPKGYNNRSSNHTKRQSDETMTIGKESKSKETEGPADKTSPAASSGESNNIKDDNDADENENSTETVTRAAAKGTLSTLILRLISFGCTQLTIRALDPSTLGTNIQLELLLTTVLFISREGFRLALTQNVVAENWTVRTFSRLFCHRPPIKSKQRKTFLFLLS
jgi:hypothetical protein